MAPRTTPKIMPKLGTINGFTSAAQLAQALVGPGVTISNATYNGDTLAAGTFSGAQVDLGIDSGVVLSTGIAADVQGPNQSDAWSTDFGRPGDADLGLIVGAQTFDAAILEFDVAPAANTLSVRFVFASEEYQRVRRTPTSTTCSRSSSTASTARTSTAVRWPSTRSTRT